MLDMWHGSKQSVVDDAHLIRVVNVPDAVPTTCACIRIYYSKMTLLAFHLFHIIHLQWFCLHIL